MKRNLLTITIAVFLLLCSQTTQAKATECKDEGHQEQLDQLELFKQFVGTWRLEVSADTVEIWEVKLYEKACVGMGYRVINGKKTFWYNQTIGFMPKQDKFKGYTVWKNGWGNTIFGSFISKNKWTGEWVRNFNPEEVTGRIEFVFETPTNFVVTHFNIKGKKTGEFKWHKIK